MKKKALLLLLAVTTLCGCGSGTVTESTIKTEKETQDETEQYETTSLAVEETTDTEVYDNSTLPYYYMQDYGNVKFNGKTLAENGNLIVCLAMLDSFYQGKYVYPDEILANYSDYISEGGKVDIDGIGQTMTEKYGHYISMPFDYVTMNDYLVDNYAYVLVRIPNPSVYGLDSTYLIVTGVADGVTAVRDANKDNIEKLSVGKDLLDQPLYDTYQLITALGENATMYIFY